MAHWDLLGNIAIIKFKREDKQKDKKEFAIQFLKTHKQIKTVLEKSDKFSGRLRTQKTNYLAGDKTKESLYKENNCLFRLNVDTCYFSPRLSAERKELAELVKKGENVLVMFGGVAPFAIVMAKLSKASKIYSVELGRDCTKYAKENVRRNKLSNVEIIRGDVRKKVPQIKEKFDRIVMARPQLKDSFLDIAFKKIKKNGIIHYHGFYFEEEKEKLRELIFDQAKKAKKKVRILQIKSVAGQIGIRKHRFRADIKVLN